MDKSKRNERKIKRGSESQGHNAAGTIRSVEKCNNLTENRTRDLPVCIIVPRPTASLGVRRSAMRNGISVLTRATRRNNPEDTILHQYQKQKNASGE
jgi:hypothetical protein